MFSTPTRAGLVTATLLAALIAVACMPVANPAPPSAGSAGNSAAPSAAPASAGEDALTRIRQSGRLVVGTAADYPPFEFLNDQFAVDGFDIALAQRIADDLGVELQLRDIAFAGLPDALALGQIDLALAAISMTAERASDVAFSMPYFVTEEAFLARSDFTLAGPLASADLQDVRIGVEEGTLFVDYLTKLLVDTGRLPARSLIRYTDLDLAIADLAGERLELVLMGAPTAKTYVQQGKVAVVEQGSFPQRYAVALAPGQTLLQEQVDATLNAMRNDGSLAALAEQYLKLSPEEIVAVAAALAAATPIAPEEAPEAPACRFGLAVVAEDTYDSQDMALPPVLVPGQPFQKQWTVRNIGTCPWEPGFSVAFAYGNGPAARFGSEPFLLQESVAPGEELTVVLDMTAPIVPGAYFGFWQMQRSDEENFGESLPAGIFVPGAPTPTPAPTALPATDLVLTADRTFALPDEAVTLSWNATGFEQLFLVAQGEDPATGAVAMSGSLTLYPKGSTTYLLRGLRADGSSQESAVTIEVDTAGAPLIETFTVVPDGEIAAGSCVDISWSVTASDLITVTLLRNEEVLWDLAPQAARLEDCPPALGPVEYRLSTTNGITTSVAGDSITVIDAPVAEAAAISAPAEAALKAPLADTANLPVISLFAVTPDKVPVLGCVTAEWEVGGDAATIRILRNDMVLLDGATTSGSGQECLVEAGTFVYTLEVTSLAGDVITATATTVVQ